MITETLKRLKQAWVQTGAYVSAVIEPNWQPVPTQPVQPLIQVVPDVRRPEVDVNTVTEIVLVELMEIPMQHFEVIGQRGRVVLVTFQPYGKFDPVIPVPLLALGPAFKKAYACMAWALVDWVNAMFSLAHQKAVYDQQLANAVYLHRAPRKTFRAPDTAGLFSEMRQGGLDALQIAAHSQQWTAPEWEYFQQEMITSWSKPDRFLHYGSENQKEQWKIAKQMNTGIRQGAI